MEIPCHCQVPFLAGHKERMCREQVRSADAVQELHGQKVAFLRCQYNWRGAQVSWSLERGRRGDSKQPRGLYHALMRCHMQRQPAARLRLAAGTLRSTRAVHCRVRQQHGYHSRVPAVCCHVQGRPAVACPPCHGQPLDMEQPRDDLEVALACGEGRKGG